MTTSPTRGELLGCFWTFGLLFLVVWQLVVYFCNAAFPAWWVLLLAALALVATPLLVHELGCYAAVLALNLKLRTLTLLEIAWLVREEDPPRWRFPRSGLRMGGMEAFPRDAAFLRARYLLFHRSGPAACLVAAVAAFWASQRLHLSPPITAFPAVGGAWREVGFLLPLTGEVLWLNLAGLLLLYLASSMAFYAGEKPALGYSALPDRATLDQAWARQALAGWLALGVRPRGWEPSLVKVLRRPNEQAEAYTPLYLYYHDYDWGQYASAGDLLDRAAAASEERPPAKASSVWVEAAFFAGFHRRDAATAQRWLDRVPEGEQEEHTLLRARAAVLYANGRHAEAAAVARQGIDAAARSRDPGGSRAESDWLRELLAACQRGRLSSSPPEGTRDATP